MDTDLLTRKFETLGARVKIGPVVRRRLREQPGPIVLDIRHDHRGEFFDLKVNADRVQNIDAIDVRPRDRHLLLLAWIRSEDVRPKVEKPRFLCGHDERHWFVAAIPEAAHASNVRTAMEALKPEEVLNAQSRSGIRFEERFTRNNRAFRRQGEWFFLPRPDLVVPCIAIRQKEPMQRSGGKAHWAEWAYRRGGETVYVSRSFPHGLTESDYRVHI